MRKSASLYVQSIEVQSRLWSPVPAFPHAPSVVRHHVSQLEFNDAWRHLLSDGFDLAIQVGSRSQPKPNREVFLNDGDASWGDAHFSQRTLNPAAERFAKLSLDHSDRGAGRTNVFAENRRSKCYD